MKPLAFIDTETTGVDLVLDRIVEISVTKVSADLLTILETRTARINPGMKIPAAATAIHGITDEMVAGKPTFAQVSKSLFDFLAGCDLAGYNIANFDVPLMAEEFGRAGISFPEPGTIFIDACNIFKAKEKRDLSGAVLFYTGQKHEDAHGAEADNLATWKVLAAQLQRYPDLGAMSRKELERFCIGDYVDLAGKIVRNEKGVPVYAFGKDIGKSVKENPGFALWMLKQSFPTNTKQVLKKILGYGG